MSAKKLKYKIMVHGIKEDSWGHSFRVTITKHQMKKLPHWILASHIRFSAVNNTNHVCARIIAKDELEAMTRFMRLWDALRTLAEEEK